MFANGKFSLRLYILAPAFMVLIIYAGMHYIFFKYIAFYYLVLLHRIFIIYQLELQLFST